MTVNPHTNTLAPPNLKLSLKRKTWIEGASQVTWQTHPAFSLLFSTDRTCSSICNLFLFAKKRKNHKREKTPSYCTTSPQMEGGYVGEPWCSPPSMGKLRSHTLSVSISTIGTAWQPSNFEQLHHFPSFVYFFLSFFECVVYILISREKEWHILCFRLLSCIF